MPAAADGRLLKKHVIPGIKENVDMRLHVLHQIGAPACTAKVRQPWLAVQTEFLLKEFWHPSSPKQNFLD